MNPYYPANIKNLVQTSDFSAASALLSAGDTLLSIAALALEPGQASDHATWYCVYSGGARQRYYYLQLPPSKGFGYNLTALTFQGIPNPVWFWVYGGDPVNLSTTVVINSSPAGGNAVPAGTLPALNGGAPALLVVTGKPAIFCVAVQENLVQPMGPTSDCEGWLMACPGGSNRSKVALPMGSGGAGLPGVHLHFHAPIA